MKDCTLVIMAAGMGSRFGKGIKQLAPIGPNNEIIMDYSIYDAVKAGFNKIVFIIRKDIKDDFDKMIGNRISKYVNVEYVFQELDNVPDKFKGKDRAKPWGTAHAILCCKDVVNEPFAIINADDYYGQEAYKILYNYLSNMSDNSDILDISMCSFILKNTLSDNGSVTRGICKADEKGNVVEITETYDIKRESDGKVMAGENERYEVSEDSRVSMNMWGCPPEIFKVLDDEFVKFLEEFSDMPKSEYLLPIVIDKLIKEGKATCKLLESHDKWFGVTYAEDKASVTEEISKLIKNGVYPEKLWN